MKRFASRREQGDAATQLNRGAFCDNRLDEQPLPIACNGAQAMEWL
jgi:hypothetical protein